MIRALLGLAASLVAMAALAVAAFAEDDETSERIVAALNQSAVGITATFTGSEIFVYGAIDRPRFADERDDGFDIIVAVTGPEEPVILRKKDRRFGIWVNTESVEIDSAPSFYAVATTGPIKDIITETSDLRYRITVEKAVRLVGEAGRVANMQEFADAIVRLRRDSGVYFEEIGAVSVSARTLFQTYIQLPSNIVEGDYDARVYLLRNGVVIDHFSTALAVRKVGLERWVYNLAQEQSLLYGIMSILVALFAGWAASEAFRLLRR